jgi:hypothetical protein
MKSHTKPRKRMTREEKDELRIDHIMQQLEEAEQEQGIEHHFERWWARGD